MGAVGRRGIPPGDPLAKPVFEKPGVIGHGHFGRTQHTIIGSRGSQPNPRHRQPRAT
ncbi:MAG: hypothetical protein OZSIB_0654 [Candidatus Ozemobacter sibiricus]|uniref:Uncharacterized protein n=1 Tax=Candidatus Ozemobacter sibiricus TaxID=2268124 RepID=A0A367ZU01_9BACT|nr:MAG: hypothetical protein OZSIB_0654 [Candidatus Ozemobacter sibiricus]